MLSARESCHILKILKIKYNIKAIIDSYTKIVEILSFADDFYK